MFNKHEDFLPIVDELTKVLSRTQCEGIRAAQVDFRLQQGQKEPYDWDAYAQVFCEYSLSRTIVGVRSI